jgi:hypothetical protein
MVYFFDASTSSLGGIANIAIGSTIDDDCVANDLVMVRLPSMTALPYILDIAEIILGEM